MAKEPTLEGDDPKVSYIFDAYLNGSYRRSSDGNPVDGQPPTARVST